MFYTFSLFTRPAQKRATPGAVINIARAIDISNQAVSTRIKSGFRFLPSVIRNTGLVLRLPEVGNLLPPRFCMCYEECDQQSL